MADPWKVLVTGSRNWDDYLAVENALHNTYLDLHLTRMTVIHGACPAGADAMADEVATGMMEAGFAVSIQRYRADWKRHGKAAGFRRNAEMIALGADLCLAFIRDGSRGASHCAALAEKAGIETRRFTA
jgi:hypothetical protein